MKKKNDSGAETPPEALVEVRIVTERGPFWRGAPLKKNQIVTLPADLFATLEKRGWAQKV